ncbi:amino acid permease [Trichoderma cornu-damae]|uniref:Amino acid permease n=1 Tax=Trichoderma cornu-damae TaxID=654480 RepID=A0A9P8TX82_9HYPO|nr:amino acid permease [Trichoderma cornu-damae]
MFSSDGPSLPLANLGMGGSSCPQIEIPHVPQEPTKDHLACARVTTVLYTNIPLKRSMRFPPDLPHYEPRPKVVHLLGLAIEGDLSERAASPGNQVKLDLAAALYSRYQRDGVDGSHECTLLVVDLDSLSLVSILHPLAAERWSMFSRQRKGSLTIGMEPVKAAGGSRLGTASGVCIPVCLNILSILMFLRFGHILGQVGFIGILGLLLAAYCIDLLTVLSLSAIASNGEVKGGGAYRLISRTLGPEFGGSIGISFYLSQALSTAMNVVGLVDCITLSMGSGFPHGYWAGYGLKTAALVLCTVLCLLGSSTLAKASHAVLIALAVAVVSIPISAVFKTPFEDAMTGVKFTGISVDTLIGNFAPRASDGSYEGIRAFRGLFGVLFPATSGIFAGASMSGDLRNPSKAIPKGTLWATLTTFIVYFTVILSMAAAITHESFLANNNVISLTSVYAPIVLAGECAVAFFSALMGVIGSAKLFQALARDELLPGLSVLGRGTKSGDEPVCAVLLTHCIAQVALFADLNQIAALISMGYQMTFFAMNLACFLLKIGSAPNFRPSFQLFGAETAFVGGLLTAAAMFFIDATYASTAICALVSVFLLIHHLCPPKHWGDVSRHLIYHQVGKHLLWLKPEHIKFWRPQIILLVNNPRRQAGLIRFCDSLKKGSLYIVGHVIVTDDFNTGVHEAKMQQQAWTRDISEFSRIKAFVQLTMSPSISWGIRNLILSSGLGGMRPNIAVLGFYNIDDLRRSSHRLRVPDIPMSPASKMNRPPKSRGKTPTRRRGDTSARLLEGVLPTDAVRTEDMMSPTEYMTALEDLTLMHRLNVAVATFDLWPIQMFAEVSSHGKDMLTSNLDTYTLILQLGHILRSVHTWKRALTLRVMVFVEYESEVEEEMARVRALLEKLRIDAEIRVFWLACGQLDTYERVVNGKSSSIDCEIVVGDALKDEEWWNDLEDFRGKSKPMPSSQELTHMTHIVASTAGRLGAYNPHDELESRRLRSSVVDLSGMPKKLHIGALFKMGIDVGMHTHHLSGEVFEGSDSEHETGSDASSLDTVESVMDPFLQETTSCSTPSRAPPSPPEMTRYGAFRQPARPRGYPADSNRPITPSYGTMSRSQTSSQSHSGRSSVIFPASQQIPRVDLDVTPRANNRQRGSYKMEIRSIESFPNLDQLAVTEACHDTCPSAGSAKSSGDGYSGNDNTSTPRPGISRQSSAARFSSQPVPETRITTEGVGSRIGFATTNSSSPANHKTDRPSFSRQSSLGKFPTRPLQKARNDIGGGVRASSYTEQPTYYSRASTRSRHRSHSRLESHGSHYCQGDVSLNIPELLQSHNFGVEAGRGEGAPYATQGLALSFNDLPSRAQHLIINELVRQNSKDTAVVLSTLPIPVKGTCSSDADTIQYLSDVELLCHDLPPALLVLSNNMTVTLSR